MTGKMIKPLAVTLLGCGLAIADEASCPFITDGSIHDIIGDSTDISSATSLSGGRTSDVSATGALEARYRTWDESEGLMIRTDKLPTMVIVR